MISDKGDEIVMIRFAYLLCWLGIHRYKVIDATFGFGAGGTAQRIKRKICGIQKIKRLH